MVFLKLQLKRGIASIIVPVHPCQSPLRALYFGSSIKGTVRLFSASAINLRPTISNLPSCLLSSHPCHSMLTMDATYPAPQYAYLTPQLEDDHVLPSSRTYLSQSSSCSTPEYIAGTTSSFIQSFLAYTYPHLSDVQFDWEVANVDGLRFNSGLWPPPTTPFPERYGESLPRGISKHEEDPLWPFASRDISQSVPHRDSLLGESFDSLMKSINQQPHYNPCKRDEPRDFSYFTSAHL